MIIRTYCFEIYGKFVDSAKKQSTYFKIDLGLFVIIVSLFWYFLLFIYLHE